MLLRPRDTGYRNDGPRRHPCATRDRFIAKPAGHPYMTFLSIHAVMVIDDVPKASVQECQIGATRQA
jgi:hypothetical protein